MSLHFIIDGYNLIKQTRLLNKINLEDSREALFRFLAVQRPQGSRSNKVTVVFDGKEGNFYSRHTPFIEVFFAQGQSADDKIKQLVEKATNPRNVVVVTNDREIQVFAKQHNAQVRPVEEFLEKFNAPQAKEIPDEKVILSSQHAAKITEEMEKIWLKK